MSSSCSPTADSTFPCHQCGLCCQNVHLSRETQFLDRGDGTCRHYASDTRTCAIYADRPDICRVDRMYATRYVRLYSWSEFVALNLQACAALAALPGPGGQPEGKAVFRK